MENMENNDVDMDMDEEEQFICYDCNRPKRRATGCADQCVDCYFEEYCAQIKCRGAIFSFILDNGSNICPDLFLSNSIIQTIGTFF